MTRAECHASLCSDGISLGKTVQTISLIALTREQGMTRGPHLIVAPLSTLSNWMDEFSHWAPSIPVLLYHGTPDERRELQTNKIFKNLPHGVPNEKFPVICTSYEIILRDQTALSKINWEFIIIVSLVRSA